MEKLIALAKKINCEYAENEPMKNHTSFKIGGKARLVVFPENENQIAEIVKCANENGIRLITMGNGSNMLFCDEDINAAILIIGKKMSKIKLIDDCTVYAEAGASLIKLCRFALENSLSGLEFAYGIPGNCGGAAFMNAGAYGGEMKDVLIKCSHIDKNGAKGFLEGKNLNLSYRSSAYGSNGCIISGLYLKLSKGKNPQEIKSKMEELLSKRKEKQPLEFPSAGSAFKRPEGYFAGALIEECNLKGKRVGGAQVSTKHAGFVINAGNASCKDVLELCDCIKKTVKSQTGVELEMEIRVTR